MSKAGYFDLALANKVGQVLEILNTENNIDAVDIINKFTASDVFAHIAEWDVAVVSQSRYYIADLFLEEYKGVELIPAAYYCKDALYWYGYLIMRWCQIEQITGKDIADNYNLESILQGYDVLHTLSVENAINHIKEDDKLEH